MKAKQRSLLIGLVLLGGLAQTQIACAAVSLTVTPAAVSSTYTGAITLQIGGLTNGETVVIKKYLDLNTNGVIDTNDLMVRDFQLTAGQSGAMVIGSVTNVNVPFNSSTNTNAITTTLNFQNGQILETLVAQYLLVVSCASGQVTNSLVVTNSYAQQFTGTVVSGANPVPNAVVVLLPPSGNVDNAPTPGVVANSAGIYTIQAPAGIYALAAYETNFLTGDTMATNLILSNGQTFTTNLSLIPATESISGKIIDATTGNGLPGVLVRMESINLHGLCYTDTNGYFTGGVTANQWTVNGEDAAVALLGYVGLNNGVPVNATGGSVTNVIVAENKASALFYGYFTNNLGTPLAGFAVEAEDLNENYDSFGSADANGYYVTGALGGLGGGDTYELNLASDYGPTNEVFSPSPYTYGNGGTNLAANTAVKVNFTDILATNYITGWLKDNYGNPIAGVQIYDFDETPINGSFYQGNGTITDPNGNYVLNVCNGTWDIYVDEFGGDNSLATNYIEPAGQVPVISNNNAVVNFTATLLPVQVTTTSLPNGTNGVAYNQTLVASYGKTPYTWTNISGALPPGLILETNGMVSGMPTVSGAFNFTVKVTDSVSETAAQALTMTVGSSPTVVLQTTNRSVTVTIGTNVTLSVSVMGTGPFSYRWQLNGTNLPNGIITTVAGNGASGYSGDGGAATNAELNPWGMTVDAIGNLFIADTDNNVIRKVDTKGIITTVAGNGYDAGTGNGGYSGDGGAATNAELNYPVGVAMDTSGNLFIADELNQRIRKVGTNGIITRIAGNGTNGFSGDGGVSTSAELYYPEGMTVDVSGNLFITDYFNDRIREVRTNGIIISVAGNGGLGYSGDGGGATNATLNNPRDVAVDVIGNLFIADEVNNRIRKVNTNGIITTVAGNGYGSPNFGGYSGDGGAATNAELYYPFSMAVDATGNLFIADTWNNVIRMVSVNGIITTVAGNGYGAGTGNGGYSGDGGAATNAELHNPADIVVDSADNLFIADYYNYRIRKVNLSVLAPTLVLSAVGSGNAGAYDVVVSSPYGSVTSSVVNLTIISAPLVLSAPQVTVGSTNITFLLSGPAGSNYVLQVSTNLLNWNPVSTSTIPVSGSITLSNAISGYKQSFYRVHLQ